MAMLVKINQLYKKGYTYVNSTQLGDLFTDLSLSFRAPATFGINNPIVLYCKHKINITDPMNPVCLLLDVRTIRSGRHLDRVLVYKKPFEGFSELIIRNNVELAIQGCFDVDSNTVAIYGIDYAVEVASAAGKRYEINLVDVYDHNYI